MLLVALTLLGLAAASDSILQDRMTNNLVENGRLHHAANAALGWGESWLHGQPGGSRPQACETDCPPFGVIRIAGSLGVNPAYQPLDWWQAQAFREGSDPLTGAVLVPTGMENPGYWLIEELLVTPGTGVEGAQPETGYYRLLARADDSGSNAYAVTESIVARPWGDPAWTDPFPGPAAYTPYCIQAELRPGCGRLSWRKTR
jgi:Tfp pilus assembly protein PilX